MPIKERKIMKKIFILFFLFTNNIYASLKIVTTTTDMESVVKKVGAEKVNVLAIARGTQDPHQLEAKPSFMVKMQDADLVIAQGIELEDAWLIPLINGSRNLKIKMSGSNYLDLGIQIDPIEKPKGEVSRAEGDVHPGGNPHFQLDPIRLGKAALIIAKKLGELDQINKSFYEKNAEDFQREMNESTIKWQAVIASSGIKEVVSFHRDISYFCNRFNIKCELQLEPKPGIPPSASHLLKVINQIKERGIKLVLIENYFDASVGDKLKAEIPSLKIVTIPVSVGGEPNIKNNHDLFERIVSVFK
jgi:zinc/manganese transport system substrate-binding protein